jgi:acetyl-CoA carboxylase biotin carboxyl carrier protein
MPLTDDDVREILRLIDESEDLQELRIETGEISLYILRGEAPVSGAEPAPPPPVDGLVTVAAPMLGTFYRAEAPGATPFVDVGARVEPDTVVCLIEVMKMMNSIPAGVAGTVVEVMATNAEPVEYGEALFKIRAAQ